MTARARAVRRMALATGAVVCAALLPVRQIAAGAGAWPRTQTRPPAVREHVEVARVIVDARVLDSDGNAVRGLGAADFRVRIDSREARVESVTWVEGGAVDEAGHPTTWRATPPLSPASSTAGRLVLFLFQKDFEPSRMIGLMRMLAEARAALAGFTPADRVGVASFDTHLKVWLDFTNRVDLLHQALERRVLFDPTPAPAPADWPSLFPRLRLDEARRAYTMERVLRLLADALAPLPGAKSLVIVGHGFGRFDGGGLWFERDYAAAVAALQAGRVTVYALDTTQADRHTLEAGLIHVAEETGGFYDRTHLFSRRGLARLDAALQGHYVLFVERPAGTRAGPHTVDVRVPGRRLTVLARRGFVG